MNNRMQIASLIILVSAVAAIPTGCILPTRSSHPIQEIPEDVPLSEFLLGFWKTEHVYLPNGNESVFGFEVNFKDYDTVEVILFENGEPTDKTVSSYSFIDSRTIFVDNKRIRGGETWYLERDGQKLIVLLEINDGKEGITLVLVRNQ